MMSRLLKRSSTPFESPLRAAVFGTGYWSTLQIPAWGEVPGVQVVAAYNRTRSKAEAVAARFGILRVYDDAEELLRHEAVDFADIIADVPAHAPLVSLAARYGVPVICQKPMGPDLATCRAIVEECRRAAVPFFIHENFRWQPPLRAVRQVLDSGRIGEPLRAHIQLGTGGFAAFVKQPSLKMLAHYALTDMGSHAFDLARFYFGEPQSVYCQTIRTSAELRGDDVATTVLRFENCICVCDISERISNRVFVEGRDGALTLNLDNSLRVTTHDTDEIRDCSTWPRYAWVDPADEAFVGADCIQSIVACHRHLADALRSGRPAETTAEDNLKTMAVMFAAIESAERDCRVALCGG